jgi:hypothetical protein
MSKDRDRLEKVIAVALNPGAYEEEAITALRKARELVRQDPKLAHPPPPPTSPPEPPPPVEHSLAFQVTKIPPYWINTFTNNVSEAAYGLGLKSKIVVELEETPRAIRIRCDGPRQACAVFEAHLNWLLTYINTQPPKS